MYELFRVQARCDLDGVFEAGLDVLFAVCGGSAVLDVVISIMSVDMLAIRLSIDFGEWAADTTCYVVDIHDIACWPHVWPDLRG